MAQRIQQIIRLCEARPAQTPGGDPIPADAWIYQAPRPLHGSATHGGRLCWRGSGGAGFHYAAVTADDPDRAHWIRRNLDLDACRLEWVTMDQIKAALIAYYCEGGYMSADEAQAEIMALSGMAADQGYILQAWVANGLNRAQEIINA